LGFAGRGEKVTVERICEVALRDEAKTFTPRRSNYANLFLKVSPEAIKRKLAALIGNPLGRPLEFSGAYDKSALAAQFRLLSFIIAEIDQSMEALPPLVLQEFEQALNVAHLCANRNNYSDRLNGNPAAGPWQVQRAIEYIQANWERPLTIEALASETGTSVRSLFAAFQKSRGCSPMAFARSVRVLHAREMLSQPTRDTSVSSVAGKCGFHNQGHFANRYVGRFGERPSWVTPPISLRRLPLERRLACKTHRVHYIIDVSKHFS
jgi:AraC-like DNA-binding protein